MIERKIRQAVENFNLNLDTKVVLTEAATGNYVVTPIIAALAGAKVFAYMKNSRYGSVEEVRKQTFALAERMGVREKIILIESFDMVQFDGVDVVTNTGFLRPITSEFIKRLPSRCVLPLMWEPWEYRADELDLAACLEHGIKVYGTNESDDRLRTMDYIGYTVLKLILDNGLSPFSACLLILGCQRFVKPVVRILEGSGFSLQALTEYSQKPELDSFNVIVLLEHERDLLLIGGKNAFIGVDEIDRETVVIHICGSVSFDNAEFRYVPDNPQPFGYMSFRTDYIDNKAVIDLHTAGLKVAEGMLKAKESDLKGIAFKNFMERNYPALAFEDPRYW